MILLRPAHCMNWLAHLFLSEPTPEFRLGSLLPDLAGPECRRPLAPDIARGIECHWRIDRFTDTHAVVRRSIGRLNRGYRRFGGILIDMFYDHFLAVDWARYAEGSLDAFAAEVYQSLDRVREAMSPEVRHCLARMKTSNLLCSYRTIAGMEEALDRLGRRFRRSVELAPAVAELRAHYPALRNDFAEFFPELREQVENFCGVEPAGRG